MLSLANLNSGDWSPLEWPLAKAPLGSRHWELSLGRPDHALADHIVLLNSPELGRSSQESRAIVPLTRATHND